MTRRCGNSWRLSWAEKSDTLVPTCRISDGMSVRLWMRRTAVRGGHIEHMATGCQRGAAPQANAPPGERGTPCACVAVVYRCAASPARPRLGI